MKSLSLDSPESTDYHGQLKRRTPLSQTVMMVSGAISTTGYSANYYHPSPDSHSGPNLLPSSSSRLHCK